MDKERWKQAGGHRSALRLSQGGAPNGKEIVADYGLGSNCTLFDKTRK